MRHTNHRIKERLHESIKNKWADAKHYFHFRLERHPSSFSLSVISVDYELGLILILKACSFICYNSAASPQLMVECSESHISCKKPSDEFEK